MNPGLPENQFGSCDSDDKIADLVEDEEPEQHVILDGPEFTFARKRSPDLCNLPVSSVGHLLNQPDCNCVANFLAQVKLMRMKFS